MGKLGGYDFRFVGNFVLIHPEFLPVIKALAATPGEWHYTKDLKENAGIATRTNGEDHRNWMAFIYRCRAIRYTEIKHDSGRQSMIRTAPGMESELKKIIKWCES